MSFSKRTATQANLPMPSPKRIYTSRGVAKTDRILEPEVGGPEVTLMNEWASPIIAKGKQALYDAACAVGIMGSTVYTAVNRWWSPQLLPTAAPTTSRFMRSLPRRSMHPVVKNVVSSTTPPRPNDEVPSDSSGQASPPTPQPNGIIGPLNTAESDYPPFVPRPMPREFAIPKLEVAERMTEPIVKTDDMRRAEEGERKQNEHIQWVRDYQRRRFEKQMMEASPGEPGAIRKAYKKRHIFQDEHDKKVKESLLKALYKVSMDGGYEQDFGTYKDYVSYRERLESSTSSVKSTPAQINEDPFAAAALHVYSESPFRRSLRKAREAALLPAPTDHFARWSADQIQKNREARARREAEIEARIKALTKKPIPKDLTDEEKAEVARIFKKISPVNECGKETIQADSVQRLKGTTWLNDEVVNFYGAMLQHRTDDKLKAAGGKPGEGGKDLPGGKRALDIYVFSSFFYSKLTEEGYAKARIGRWTKKFDIFKKDKIIFPMNIGGMHWTTGCIDFCKKRIEWYDSLQGSSGQIFQELRKYLDLEHREKRKKPFDFTGWVDYACEDYPQQQNGSDCGVFTALGMEALTREAEFNFEQSNIPYFRRLMVLEIGRGKLEKIPTREP
ncbi:cysteine proteinase [Dacryopinax primogenitus]|uniref:Cysteine proteinase n=1 Tax=Dacryopinax primogenitus (strain DJM 731) TaxID=1858805 RepID=M5G582_DACPD|nr:cysteine proteinase [Dacryopinax primogenitus]EJU00992.1 cysteine proteinase [Dacryopinax primogenitus]